jgi:N-acyl-D-aspartate/D-glutamate deacylase
MPHDLIIRGGTVVDGTGADRFVADIAVSGDRIAAIGDLADVSAREEIDARGLIVAPGIIDLHTHYDAQLHWDPYCTASGWHGTTSVMIGNCGFGFAPVQPGMADRYMYMMENTEQVPYDAMKRSMPWTWRTFPEWMDNLRWLPKGINIATYLPMNALLSYVIGADEAKTRPATAAERAEMRRILGEAMDAGASGFSFSFLGAEGNSHVDHDQTAMPTDVMAAEEAYNLAEVLRARDQGAIQCIVELPSVPEPRRWIVEELARRSGRPVLHNIVVAAAGQAHCRSVMRWLDEVSAKGLNIWSQGFTFRKPLEIDPLNFNNWDSAPIFRELSAAHTAEEKLHLIRNTDYRARFERDYNPRLFSEGRELECYMIAEAEGDPEWQAYQDRYLPEIAAELGRTVPQLFLDILDDTGFKVVFVNPSSLDESAHLAELLRHPRVLPGVSDGGAHSKHGNGGFWSTDMIMQLTRETSAMRLEDLHHRLSARNAQVAGFTDRGVLVPGAFADLIAYDWEKLNYDPPVRYEKLYDLPGGDWRKVKRAVGMRYIVVNGQITFEDGVETGTVPGRILQSASSAKVGRTIAAE